MFTRKRVLAAATVVGALVIAAPVAGASAAPLPTDQPTVAADPGFPGPGHGNPWNHGGYGNQWNHGGYGNQWNHGGYGGPWNHGGEGNPWNHGGFGGFGGFGPGFVIPAGGFNGFGPGPVVIPGGFAGGLGVG
jgi:hypothetical protein